MTNSACHQGNVKVFEYGKAALYASGWSRGMQPLPGAILIDLTGEHYSTYVNKNAGPIKVYDQEAKNIFKPVLDITKGSERPIWLSLYIKDFGIPTWEPEVWHVLAQILSEQMESGHDVVIGCQGGHGRTGLAVSILASLMGVVDEADPIAWLRKRYCENAVETDAQAKYVYDNVAPDLPADQRSKGLKNDSWGSYDDGKQSKLPATYHAQLHKPKRKAEKDECLVCLRLLTPSEKSVHLCIDCYREERQLQSEKYSQAAKSTCLSCEKAYSTMGNNMVLCEDCLKNAGQTLDLIIDKDEPKKEQKTSAHYPGIDQETAAKAKSDYLNFSMDSGLGTSTGVKKNYVIDASGTKPASNKSGKEVHVYTCRKCGQAHAGTRAPDVCVGCGTTDEPPTFTISEIQGHTQQSAWICVDCKHIYIAISRPHDCYFCKDREGNVRFVRMSAKEYSVLKKKGKEAIQEGIDLLISDGKQY